jgi:hypothetical protein
MLQSLIEQYQEAQQQVNDLYNQLCNTSDGYYYTTCLRCYGSLSWQDHVNSFTVQELCNEYYGDNGIVDVYTTNPNHNISTYGDVHVVSKLKLVKMRKSDISMGAAVTNWITRSAGF